MGGSHRRSACFGEQINLSLLRDFEPRISQSVAYSLNSLHYSGSHAFIIIIIILFAVALLSQHINI
jgi:hypothetical protein